MNTHTYLDSGYVPVGGPNYSTPSADQFVAGYDIFDNYDDAVTAWQNSYNGRGPRGDATPAWSAGMNLVGDGYNDADIVIAVYSRGELIDGYTLSDILDDDESLYEYIEWTDDHDAPIVVQREGSAVRTDRELIEQLYYDAVVIVPAVSEYVDGDSWAQYDELELIIHDVESSLADNGYSVTWDDGYIIRNHNGR